MSERRRTGPAGVNWGCLLVLALVVALWAGAYLLAHLAGGGWTP